MLSDKEASVLHAEIEKCSVDFEFIARNYFWITEKSGADCLLRLWDSQELTWETIKRLKARGRGVKLLVVKARQLGISVLIESIIAWLCMFNPNFRGLVVSYDIPHSAELFNIILHIYDQLPWWLRPMIGPRKYEQGIHLINPAPELRRLEPGLNSRIIVQAATQYTGIAEGRAINAAHGSEIGSYDPAKARKMVHGDFRWALPDEPNTFAVLETRVRQASKMVERLWEGQMRLGDLATWYPLFLPIYFDKSHFVAPESGWQPEDKEKQVKARAADEWCTCSGCGQIRPAVFGKVATAGTSCIDCKSGIYRAFELSHGQMRWLWEQRLNAEAMGDKAIMEMNQSLATNPQEAFAGVTETVFSKKAVDWVIACTRDRAPRYEGYMSDDGKFHAPLRDESDGALSAQCYCKQCREDHRGRPGMIVKVWQTPVAGAKYSMGVDVASGMGGVHDYSVIWVNKVSQMPYPDVQVCMFRSNSVNSLHLADVANHIGRWYNNALAGVDYSNLQTTGDRLYHQLKYPNVLQWKNLDSKTLLTNKVHWVWNEKNKESAWQTLAAWLEDQSLIPRDPVFAREVRCYQRHRDGKLGAPETLDDDTADGDYEKVYDDTIQAAEIALISAHQLDYIRSSQQISQDREGLQASKEWMGTCGRCDKSFYAGRAYERERCPWCDSFLLRWKKIVDDKPDIGFSWEGLGAAPGSEADRYGAPQELTF